jgi:SAM-dependent methyltransferase
MTLSAALLCLAVTLPWDGSAHGQRAGGQAPAPAARDDSINRPTSEPYKGNPSIFEQEGRAERLQIDRVMDLLGIREGSAVADIGAGSGWFTVRAARRAGPAGVVFAVEINEEFLELIARRAKEEGLTNVRTVRGAEDDPRLGRASVDAVLILKTYHEFAEPIAIMRRVREALRPRGVVGIIDRNGAGDDHGLGEGMVVEEMGRAGFRLVTRHDFVKPDKMDYFLIFETATAERMAAPGGL